MAKKKEETKKDETPFDVLKALNECPKPEWYKKAFLITMDTSKVKNQNDLVKLMKTYGEMK